MPLTFALHRRHALKLAGTLLAGVALGALLPAAAAGAPDMAANKAQEPGEYVLYP